MRVEYSKHARQRMRQRGITDSEVRQCLSNPTLRTVTAKGACYMAHLGKGELKVVVALDQDTDADKYVITTMWRGRR